MELNEINFDKEKTLERNLFKRSNIIRLFIVYDNEYSTYSKDDLFRATLFFKTGDLSGEKNFRSKTYEELMSLIEDFIKSLGE